jgi:glyoxylase-like metal-dependent hydrolase (beta-lactamase superfamily II)
MLQAGQIDEIAPGVRRVVANNGGMMTGAGTNTYVLGTRDFIVIDPGPADDLHISRVLEITQGRIGAVVATHTHPDHSPAAVAIAKKTHAALLGMTIADDGHQDLTFKPTSQIGEADRINIENLQLRVIHTPGHVGNQLCFLLEGAGLLFTGDHMNQGTTVVILPPGGSMADYLRSMRRLIQEPVTRIAPGHGYIIEDAQAEIVRIIEHRLQRESKVMERLHLLQPISIEKLVLSVYDDVDSRLHRLAQSSLLAHLLKLEEEGRAQRNEQSLWSMHAV